MSCPPIDEERSRKTRSASLLTWSIHRAPDCGIRSPLLAGVVLSETGPRSAGFGKPVLDAIQMSPRSMDALLAAVDFPSFVAGVI